MAMCFCENLCEEDSYICPGDQGVRYVEVCEDCEDFIECELCEGFCNEYEGCECCDCDNYGDSCNMRFDDFKRPELVKQGVCSQCGPDYGNKRTGWQDEGEMCRLINIKNQRKIKPIKFCKKEVGCLMKQLKNVVSVFPLSRGREDTEIIVKPIRGVCKPQNHNKERTPVVKITMPRMNRQNQFR